MKKIAFIKFLFVCYVLVNCVAGGVTTDCFAEAPDLLNKGTSSDTRLHDEDVNAPESDDQKCPDGFMESEDPCTEREKEEGCRDLLLENGTQCKTSADNG